MTGQAGKPESQPPSAFSPSGPVTILVACTDQPAAVRAAVIPGHHPGLFDALAEMAEDAAALWSPCAPRDGSADEAKARGYLLLADALRTAAGSGPARR